MKDRASLLARLTASLDREAAVALLATAVGHESVTGNEAGFASFLESELHKRRATAVAREDFLPGRPNVWGERNGAGGGPRLLLAGHTDTVHVRGWREKWAGTERESPFCGAIVDGELWGRGSGDMKAGICAGLAALDLLDRAGVRLAGDVAFAFVGDEESGEPGTGVSAGIKDYTARVLAGEVARPDFAVYLEPTRLAVYPAQIGFFIADIEITGRTAYFGVPEEGLDALKAAHRALSAIWKLSDRMNARSSHDLLGRAFLLVTTLRGGGYIAVPGECSFSLIGKVLPGASIDEACAELEEAVRGAVGDPDIGVAISWPAGRDHPRGGSPVEIERERGPVRSLSEILRLALPGRGGIEGAPYWSEVPFLVETIGCPAVYCAPGDIRNCHTLEERVEVAEYLAGIVAFAAFFTEYCGVTDT